MKRTTATILALLVAGAAHAEDAKTVTQLLLEKDAQLALQKLDKDIANTAPAPLSVNAAPAGQAKDARSEAPKTIAIYGVDGRAAGLPVTLRSYVKWDDQVYAAKVGGTVRGYKVMAITETGTRLARGKHIVSADRVDDDAVILVGEEKGARPAATPAATPPAGAPPSMPGPALMPMPMPMPAALPVPTPASMPAALPSTSPAASAAVGPARTSPALPNKG